MTMSRLGLMPYSPMSTAFLKSMKTWYRFCGCFSYTILRFKICSAMLSSACGFSLLSMCDVSMSLLLVTDEAEDD